jgi:hypothetical protein
LQLTFSIRESTSGSESDISSVISEDLDIKSKKKKMRKKPTQMREQFGDSFKELQELYDSAKKHPWTRKIQ